jgi:hypothetical protein
MRFSFPLEDMSLDDIRALADRTRSRAEVFGPDGDEVRSAADRLDEEADRRARNVWTVSPPRWRQTASVRDHREADDHRPA